MCTSPVLASALTAQDLHPQPYFVGDGRRQLGDGGLDPYLVRVPVQFGILDQQVAGGEELADPLGGEVGPEQCEVMDVTLLEGSLGPQPVHQDREGADVLAVPGQALSAPPQLAKFPVSMRALPVRGSSEQLRWRSRARPYRLDHGARPDSTSLPRRCQMLPKGSG
ncbi:hypothetical protein ACFWBF_19920 [Streptomyces sp. NPDC060028]|uniref:hypothetical protein n=1 Tax=Streptomyces sp. NPDC060028 TaxID=3347041 RepID=UPI0036D1E5EF